MELDKLYENLGLDKLDEDKQKEIKDYLQDTIDLKVQESVIEQVNEKLEDEKKDLVTQYENKFETYKDEITEKFSNFVDEILESELQIPDTIREFARKGELYAPVLEQVKILLGIDEGNIEEPIKDVLREAKQEILSLKDRVNLLMSEKIELTSDAKNMASDIYLRNKCDGLTESKRKSVMSILEGITDTEIIDKKFDIIVENYNPKNSLNEKVMYCPKCDVEVEVNEEETENLTCPDCGSELIDSKGKTNEAILPENKPEPISESFDIREHWKQLIKTGRY